MADFKPFLDDFGFLPHEKGLEPVRNSMDSVVTSRIVSHLKTKLDSPKKSEKLAAAWELAQLKDKRLWPILKKNLFEETDFEIVNELLSAFLNNTNREGPELLAKFILQEKRFKLRKKAIWVLSHYDNSKTTFSVLKQLALSDANSKVRKEAVAALSEIKSKETSRVLSDVLLSDEEAGVRQMAVWALGRIRMDYAPVLRALEEDTDADVRREAAWILGRNNADEGLEKLLSALKRESNQKVLEVVLWSIAKIDAESLNEADFVLEEDEYKDRVKAEYIWLLGRYNQKKQIKKIARIYLGLSLEIKRALIWAMSQTDLVGKQTYLRDWYKKEKNKDLKDKILWSIDN